MHGLGRSVYVGSVLGPGLPAAPTSSEYGPLPSLRAMDLVSLTRSGCSATVAPRFRSPEKIETVAARRARPVVVVNLSETEPWSPPAPTGAERCT